MSPLHTCPHCSSLNPQGQTVCLNCDADLMNDTPKRSGLVGNLLKGVGLVAISMTLSACYGGGEPYVNDCIDSDLDGACSYEDCDDNDSSRAQNCEESTSGETMGD